MTAPFQVFAGRTLAARSRARIRRALGVAVVASLLSAGPALAGHSGITSGDYVSAKWALASNDAHSQVQVVFNYADHSACDALGQGWTGQKYNPNGRYYRMIVGDCAYQGVYWYPLPVSGYFHGVVYNDNAATQDYVSRAYYDWGA